MYGYSRARTAPVGGTRTPRTPVMLSRKGRLPRVITVPPDTGRPKILSGSEHSRPTCTGAPSRGQYACPMHVNRVQVVGTTCGLVYLHREIGTHLIGS